MESTGAACRVGPASRHGHSQVLGSGQAAHHPCVSVSSPGMGPGVLGPVRRHSGHWRGAAHGAEAGGQLGLHLLLASVRTRGAGPSVPPGSPWDSIWTQQQGLRPCPEEVTRACACTWLLGGEVGRTMGSHLKSLRGVVPCSVCVVGVHSESWKTSMTSKATWL